MMKNVKCAQFNRFVKETTFNDKRFDDQNIENDKINIQCNHKNHCQSRI